jgi:hypothetical protein
MPKMDTGFCVISVHTKQDKEGTRPDLLATTGEFLRIWQVGEEGVTLQRLLDNMRRSSKI